MSKKQRARHSTSILTSARKRKAQATLKDPERLKKRKRLVYLVWFMIYTMISCYSRSCWLDGLERMLLPIRNEYSPGAFRP